MIGAEWPSRLADFEAYLNDANFTDGGKTQIIPLPPPVRLLRDCDRVRQCGVQRFGLNVETRVRLCLKNCFFCCDFLPWQKSDELLLFKPQVRLCREQWMLRSCEDFPADLSLLFATDEVNLAAWPIEHEERVSSLLAAEGFERGRALDLAELWVLDDAAALPRDLVLPDGFA